MTMLLCQNRRGFSRPLPVFPEGGIVGLGPGRSPTPGREALPRGWAEDSRNGTLPYWTPEPKRFPLPLSGRPGWTRAGLLEGG